MSHIIVHRIEDIAKRRIGRTAQVFALPPQPQRHTAKHWQLNRRSFVHGFYAGNSNCGIGKDYAPLCKFKAAAIEAGVDPVLVNALTLDELLVTPDLISGTVGGRFITTSLTARPGGRGAPTAKVEYEPSGRGDVATVRVFSLDPFQTVSGGYVPENVFLRGVSLEVSNTGGDSTGINVRIGNHTTLIAGAPVNTNPGDGGQNVINLPLMQFIDRGGPLIMEYGLLDVGGAGGLDAYASVSFEYGVPKAA